MKYQILINILDRLRNESTKKYKKIYCPIGSNIEKVNNAHGRAFIHLYLKVAFGIVDFEEREKYLTDGTYDGGIDGYYIDLQEKLIFLIQSKFRTNEKNFENKEIKLKELLSMDVNRILEGEKNDEQGNEYNGKIKQLQREVANISDIARYKYKIILLANISDVSPSNLKKITGGYEVEVFNFEKSYNKLVFPIISGTYFNATDISIPIDLSNKNAGSKISYTVKTRIGDCEITVLFIPAIEIAKIMSKYKNSILLFNPRSYLDLEGQSINNAIRETILNSSTNEFALYNNGITLLSDETFINERIGQKNKAQLIVKNPQIINGGQTSYTLSRIYEENKDNNPDSFFQGKELLLKTITLIDTVNQEDKSQLIDEISNATNKQSVVINADKYANDIFHQKLQKIVFDRYGLLYERKRGEFSDGLRNNYIDKEIIIERNLFLRIFYSANGMINKGSQKRLFQSNKFPEIDLDNYESFDKFYLGLRVFKNLVEERRQNRKLSKEFYAKIFIYILLFFSDGLEIPIGVIEKNIYFINKEWENFINLQRENSPAGRKTRIDRETGEKITVFSEHRYIQSKIMENDVKDHFHKLSHQDS